MSETNSIAEGKANFGAHALAPPTEEEKKMDRKILLKTDLFVLTILVLVATIEFLVSSASCRGLFAGRGARTKAGRVLG